VSRTVVVAVRVTPRASREAVEGVDTDGVLHVRVTAPPADGAANAAVTRLLAKTLGVPKGAVSLASGEASRHKRVRIEGATRGTIERRWPGVRVGG
jgi:uncharacterized protein (TIGR00251 family)